MLNQTFSIIDVETTGGSPFLDRIIEIGLLRVEKGEVVKTYQTLLNPGVALPEFITELTGITDADLLGAPTFDDIKEELFELLEDSILVAHNASFDYGFIGQEFRRSGWSFSMNNLCTVRLSRVLYPEHKHHNLDALIERHGFSIDNRHRAFDDAKILWDFLQMLPTQFPREQVEKAIKRTMLKIPPKKQLHMQQQPPPEELTYIYEE